LRDVKGKLDAAEKELVGKKEQAGEAWPAAPRG
jgi:hypothetical protein